MSQFVKLASLDNLPPGASAEVEHSGRIIALFNQGGQVFALDGMCPHQGGPLAQGALENDIVTCPWHGWQFHVRNGQCLINPRIRQSVYDVRVENGEILVELPS